LLTIWVPIVNRACGSSSTIDTIFGQWFMRRRFLNLYKSMFPYVEAIYDPRDFISTNLPQSCPLPNIKTFRPVVHEKKSFKGFSYINLYKIMSR